MNGFLLSSMEILSFPNILLTVHGLGINRTVKFDLKKPGPMGSLGLSIVWVDLNYKIRGPLIFFFSFYGIL